MILIYCVVIRHRQVNKASFSCKYSVYLHCIRPEATSLKLQPLLLRQQLTSRCIIDANSQFVSLRDDNLSVLGSCQVKPPQPWCIMYPKDLSDVASVGAMCFSKVGPGGDQVQIEGSESSSWELSEVGKLN